MTNDMIKDENKWINELARELGEVLRGMMRDRGIIALDEVWGGWNRARGVGTFFSRLPSPLFHRHLSTLVPNHD